MNQLINDGAVYRTAPATPGLLIISLPSFLLSQLFTISLPILFVLLSCSPAFPHRRYSDFLSLRSTLLKETPSTASRIPFPPKRWVGSNLEPAFLGRRLAGLQVFLATAMEDQELGSSPALGEFLCLDQR